MPSKITFSFLVILFTLITYNSYAQEGLYKPFKLVIISPDTAIVDPQFKPYIDTLQNAHLKRYYQAITQMESMVDFKDYPKDEAKRFEETKKRVQVNLIEAKKAEAEIKRFKYYQTISEYSSQVLNMYFNEYPPLSAIGVVKKQSTDIKSLSYLADSLKADYVICYHNIHSESENNELILKLTTILYSNSDHKILFEKETKGDTDSRGDMWSCSDPLGCLLVSGIKSSTDLVFPVIAKRQHK